ncbi:MAG: HEAT repeat domain-containing protein [Bryobacterales bacterium]|nr:HEAT repeat domain-containing protein [Bryobacterales bacterium]
MTQALRTSEWPIFLLEALGNLRDLRAVPILIDYLRDRRATVVEKAAIALGQLGDRRAVEPLRLARPECASPGLRTGPPSQRRCAGQTLSNPLAEIGVEPVLVQTVRAPPVACRACHVGAGRKLPVRVAQDAAMPENIQHLYPFCLG